jgi:hypothetical protein
MQRNEKQHEAFVLKAAFVRLGQTGTWATRC